MKPGKGKKKGLEIALPSARGKSFAIYRCWSRKIKYPFKLRIIDKKIKGIDDIIHVNPGHHLLP